MRHTLAHADKVGQHYPFPYALCGPQLAAVRAAHPLSAQARFNRPLPGVCETQCPGCGMLTSGPRAGWYPARYDAGGVLIPVALNPIEVPASGLCAACVWTAQEIAQILRSPRRRAHPTWLAILGLRPAVIAYLLAHTQGVAA